MNVDRFVLWAAAVSERLIAAGAGDGVWIAGFQVGLELAMREPQEAESLGTALAAIVPFDTAISDEVFAALAIGGEARCLEP